MKVWHWKVLSLSFIRMKNVLMNIIILNMTKV